MALLIPATPNLLANSRWKPNSSPESSARWTQAAISTPLHHGRPGAEARYPQRGHARARRAGQLVVLDKDLARRPARPRRRPLHRSRQSRPAPGPARPAIAAYQDAAWAFYAPREGWLAWVADEDRLYVATAPPGASRWWRWRLGNVVDDTTPQLGGNLDANGHNIGFDNGTGITDDIGNEQVMFHKTASAVNQVGITNAATGTAPQIAAEGGDTNIDLTLRGKGTGYPEAALFGVNATADTTTVRGRRRGHPSSTTPATAISTRSTRTRPATPQASCFRRALGPRRTGHRRRRRLPLQGQRGRLAPGPKPSSSIAPRAGLLPATAIWTCPRPARLAHPPAARSPALRKDRPEPLPKGRCRHGNGAGGRKHRSRTAYRHPDLLCANRWQRQQYGA